MDGLEPSLGMIRIMTTKTTSPRYYQNPRDIRKQLPTLLPIVIMFILTVIYASGLRNQTVRTALLYMSLAYPAVIAIGLSFAIPKVSYYQIDSAGVHATILGFIRKHIYWSDIESIGPATIGNVEGIGLMYVSSFNRDVFGRKSRRRMFGWDEILSNAHTENGASFADEITKHFKKHLSTVNR